ncbi:cGMP-specific 3',5'-cyclic phosphodiesterase-like [Plutella xylostella]|uniref:cGMP-specific 3',5'-cyclic phosphodiesterase-like n=1 Tax=Plutella xylostella TaxID=51655 RepID=UPI002032A5B3|nr:cGMP-specific 3',5'-cyclic phosphodiesterase-like [Plutella xylostella]
MRGPYKVTKVLPSDRYELKLLSGGYGKTTQAAAEYMVPWRGEWCPDTCAAFFANDANEGDNAGPPLQPDDNSSAPAGPSSRSDDCSSAQAGHPPRPDDSPSAPAGPPLRPDDGSSAQARHKTPEDRIASG